MPAQEEAVSATKDAHSVPGPRRSVRVFGQQVRKLASGREKALRRQGSIAKEYYEKSAFAMRDMEAGKRSKDWKVRLRLFLNEPSSSRGAMAFAICG